MKSRTLVAALAAVAFLLVSGEAPSKVPSKSPQPPEVTFESVSPAEAAPGDRITIVLSKNADGTGAGVSFGALKATVESAVRNVLYVRVPEDLKSGETPPITVFLATGPVTYLGFKVLYLPVESKLSSNMPYAGPVVNKALDGAGVVEPLKILGVAPGSASPGSEIVLSLSRPLDHGRPAKLFLGGTETKIAPVADATVLHTTVPKEASPGPLNISLLEGDIATAPYQHFTVIEQTFLGIGRSVWPRIGWTLVFLVSAIIAFYGTRRSRSYDNLTKRYDAIQVQLGAEGPTVAGAPVVDIPPPAVPPELAQLCAARNCLLFAGPGLGAQSRLPTFYEALLHLIDKGDFEDSLKAQLGTALAGGQLSFVTEVLSAKISRDVLIAELQILFAGQDVGLSPSHKALQKIPFTAALTTGWDGLIEKTFEKRNPVVLTGEKDFEEAHRGDAFFIARLNGDLYDERSFIFSSDEYRRTLYERPTYAKFVASQVLSRSVFFVGMSLSGIEDFYDAFRFPVRSTLKSYAIVSHTNLFEAQKERFLAKYGIELIPYQVTPGHPELAKFLEKLEKAVSALAPPEKAARQESQMAALKLRRVELQNIGAFETLVLDDLQSGWNVLLGNNGAGKSTILKAVALGLCGEDPEATINASRLLRGGTHSGRIRLLVGEITYQTDLYREGERVIVRCEQLTPLQKGNWVVLGFPPLRGVSTGDPGGASTAGGDVRQARVADLLPLIDGKVDTRLNSLKQWLVNLWVDTNVVNDGAKADAERAQRTMNAFYKLLQAFTPGQRIEAGDVKRGATWTVYVKTEDGEVPIDNVSQGMSSVFGWVGTLLQRMYEIYPDSPNPTSEAALVLVDEIDAHLHPEWQQKLTPIVKEHLPNVQMIATTHSPLLVAGMKQQELLIAMRDPAERSKVTVSRSLVNPEGLRADQILTTPLFGLQSSRSPEVNAKIAQYATLLGNTARTEVQEQDFRKLKEELAAMLLYGETERERHEEREATARRRQKIEEVTAAIAASSDEVKTRLREEL